MRTSKWVILELLGILCAIALIYFSPKPQSAIPQEPSYALSQPARNQPLFYPLKQNIDPKLYHSVGDWVGRLILPSRLSNVPVLEIFSLGGIVRNCLCGCLWCDAIALVCC
ncbi:MAG: hypothetical protein RID53_15415 [Coleofasciculus sp. B1-GNL1-01]|uniref:hypothetical protein n=1 Tax=Coleofasciculus sp. B1-GNL1-01 TaxID=3068484 RepID=UPI0032FE3A53